MLRINSKKYNPTDNPYIVNGRLAKNFIDGEGANTTIIQDTPQSVKIVKEGVNYIALEDEFPKIKSVFVPEIVTVGLP